MRKITTAGAPLLRTRDPDDLEACVAVLGAVHAADGYPVNWPTDPAGWLSGDGHGAAWVAQWGGRIVGHVMLVRPDAGDAAPALAGAAGGGTAVVSRLFVDPAARGHRIGAALLDRAAREARRRGARAVLDVAATDAAAVALYERLGWEFLGAARQCWGPGESVTVRCYAAPPARRCPQPSECHPEEPR